MIFQNGGAQLRCVSIPSWQTCSKKLIHIIKFFCPSNHIDLDVTNGDQLATTLVEEIQQLNADVIVECYLDAKYYDYDPVELNDIVDFNANVVELGRRGQHCHCGECRSG